MLTRIVNGETVVLSTEEEAAFLAESDANLISSTEETRIRGIKAEAKKRIIGLLPSCDYSNYVDKELNLITRNADLDDIVLNGSVLTTEQIAEKESYRVLKTKILDIRTMSNTAEANGDSLAAFQAALDLKGY